MCDISSWVRKIESHGETVWILHIWGYNWTFWSILANTNNFWLLWQFLVTNYKLVALIIFNLELGEPNCYLKKEGFYFCSRFGDLFRAFYNIPNIIIPTLKKASIRGGKIPRVVYPRLQGTSRIRCFVFFIDFLAWTLLWRRVQKRLKISVQHLHWRLTLLGWARV